MNGRQKRRALSMLCFTLFPYWNRIIKLNSTESGGSDIGDGVYDTRQQNEPLPHCNQLNVSISKWWQDGFGAVQLGSELDRIESNQVNECARLRRAGIVKIIGKASLTTS